MKKIYDTAGYISDVLTHWTGHNVNEEVAFSNLKSILNSCEFRFGKPENNLQYQNETGNKIGQAMICFTDTPIEQAYAHRKKYGQFGICFSKENLIKYGAHPVFYYLDTFEESAKYFLNLSFSDNEKIKENWLSCFFQPYKSNNSEEFPYYFEREWRICRMLPHQNRNLDSIEQYQFEGQIIFRDGTHYLQFDKEIIESVIVPQKYYDRIKKELDKNKIECEIYALIN